MYILLGTHSTGKSTLLQSVNKVLPEYYITDGFSRPIKIAKEDLGLNKFQEQTLINELTCWAFENYIPQQVISTRSPIDGIIYTKYYTPDKLEDSLEKLITTFDKFKDKIEGIFYIPIEFELEDDGVRFNNKEDQKNIDILIQEFIKENKLNVITVKGSIEERTKTVVETIRRNRLSKEF